MAKLSDLSQVDDHRFVERTCSIFAHVVKRRCSEKSFQDRKQQEEQMSQVLSKEMKILLPQQHDHDLLPHER